MNSVHFQQSIKNNNEEFKDYARGLKAWADDIRKEDAKLCSLSNTEKPQNNLPVRSQLRKKKPQIIVKGKSKKGARISSYDYAAWNKYADEALQSSSEDETENNSSGKTKNNPPVNTKNRSLVKSVENKNNAPVNSVKAEKDTPFKQNKTENNTSVQLLKTENNLPINSLKTENNPPIKLVKTENNSPVKSVGRNSNYYKEQGNQLYSKGKFADAVAKYTQGIALDSSNFLVFANRAMACIKLKKFKAAENDCTRAISINSSYVKSYMRRATCRINLNDLSGAVQDYEKILTIEPTNKDAQKELESLRKLISSSNDDAENEPKSLSTKANVDSKSFVQEEKNKNEANFKTTEKNGQALKTVNEFGENNLNLSKLTLNDNNLSDADDFTFKSMEPLRTVMVTEVESLSDIDEIIGIKSENEPKIERIFESKSEISPKSSFENETQLRNLPNDDKLKSLASSKPKTSHQFTQTWRKLKHYQGYKMEYLMNIPEKFFKGTELDADVLIEILLCISDGKATAVDATKIMKQLTLTQGFEINISFLDNDQKTVIKRIIEKIQENSDNEFLKYLRGFL